MHACNPIDVVAVSVDYVFLERDRPAAIVRFSAPMPGGAFGGESGRETGVEIGGAALLPAVERTLLDGLAVIDTAVIAATDGHRARRHPDDPLPGFVPLVRPPRSDAQNGLGARMLQLFDRRRSDGR